jgi:uncharacterized Zn finger protein (UPF0148 family)
MKCLECGSQNPAIAKVCQICGSKLETKSRDTQQSQKTPVSSNKKTVIGLKADTPPLDSNIDKSSTPNYSRNPEEPINNSQEIKCKKCNHYPLHISNGNAVCPNCGYSEQISSVEGNDLQSELGGDKETRILQESDKERSTDIIKDAASDKVSQSKYKTQSISDINLNAKGRFKLIDQQTGKEIIFEGEEVILNRDSLDADNRSISGRSHAKLTFADGTWTIEDQSSNKATFIQIRQPTILDNQVIIQLGNKFYMFESQ